VALRVLQPQREPGVSGQVTVFFLRQRLGAGTAISEGVTQRLVTRLSRPAWLFWEDLGHTVLFPHASTLLLVDAGSGKTITLSHLTFFPLVNGKPPVFFRTPGAYFGSAGAIYARSHGLASVQRLSFSGNASVRHAGPKLRSLAARRDFSSDAIVTVGARTDPVFEQEFKAIEKFGEDLKVPVEKVDLSEKGVREKDAIKKALKKVTDAGKKDVLLFIAGHGQPDHDVYYEDKDGKQVLQAAGSKLPKVILDDRGTSALSLGPITLEAILKAFPETTFKIVIESCYSGRFLPMLKTVPNVKIMITSAPADKPSHGGFGQVLAKALREWAFPTTGQPDPPDLVGGLKKAFNSPSVKTNSELTKDDPQIYVAVPTLSMYSFQGLDDSFTTPTATIVQTFSGSACGSDPLTAPWTILLTSTPGVTNRSETADFSRTNPFTAVKVTTTSGDTVLGTATTTLQLLPGPSPDMQLDVAVTGDDTLLTSSPSKTPVSVSPLPAGASCPTG
jgi:hypothetical protein